MSYDNNCAAFLNAAVTSVRTGVYSTFTDDVPLLRDPANEQDPPKEKMTDLTRQQVTDLLAASEAKVDARLANFESTIKTGFSDAKAEMADLRTDMHKMNAEIKTWTLATMLTIIGTMLAAIFGVATIFNNASKSAAPAVPQAPIIITMPAQQPPASSAVTPQPLTPKLN